jgi:hypothetical protein
MEAIMRDYLGINVLNKCTKLYMRTSVKKYMSITSGLYTRCAGTGVGYITVCTMEVCMNLCMHHKLRHMCQYDLHFTGLVLICSLNFT